MSTSVVYFPVPTDNGRPRKVGWRVAGDGCWEWAGARIWNGYGRVVVHGKQHFAHRAVYEHFVGMIPGGMTLDHLCRNRACVNPSHMEAVSLKENILRGSAPAALNAAKTHCNRGHAFTADNLAPAALRRGRRRCWICERERDRNRRAAQFAADVAPESRTA